MILIIPINISGAQFTVEPLQNTFFKTLQGTDNTLYV